MSVPKIQFDLTLQILKFSDKSLLVKINVENIYITAICGILMSKPVFLSNTAVWLDDIFESIFSTKSIILCLFMSRLIGYLI